MTQAVRILPIVEGHGEVSAVPVLIRRIALEMDPGLVPSIPPPIRVPASSLRREGGLEKAVDLAARKLDGKGGVFILLDCDWANGCPAKDGPEMLGRARQARPDIPVSLVLARSEFESWFLAAAESPRGRRGLPEDLVAPPNPEAIRGAKEWLNQRASYSPTVDQPAYTQLFDMEAARRADSFDKCLREIRSLLLSVRTYT